MTKTLRVKITGEYCWKSTVPVDPEYLQYLASEYPNTEIDVDILGLWTADHSDEIGTEHYYDVYVTLNNQSVYEGDVSMGDIDFEYYNTCSVEAPDFGAIKTDIGYIWIKFNLELPDDVEFNPELLTYDECDDNILYDGKIMCNIADYDGREPKDVGYEYFHNGEAIEDDLSDPEEEFLKILNEKIANIT